MMQFWDAVSLATLVLMVAGAAAFPDQGKWDFVMSKVLYSVLGITPHTCVIIVSGYSQRRSIAMVLMIYSTIILEQSRRICAEIHVGWIRNLRAK